uniref:Uncharacterized protein n=1 Tax=Anguilla anguilla TaxID=7936 RepID=A0A0E9SQ82_ANGAN
MALHKNMGERGAGLRQFDL